jgi:hypothetical protein
MRIIRIILSTLAMAAALFGCSENEGAGKSSGGAPGKTGAPGPVAAGGSGGLRFEVPADFPIKIPAAATHVVYTDDTSNGQRQRTVVFQAGGSRQPLIAHCEKEMRANGLEPRAEDVPFGPSKVTSIAAERGSLNVQIGLFEDTPGQHKVVIAWMERLE